MYIVLSFFAFFEPYASVVISSGTSQKDPKMQPAQIDSDIVLVTLGLLEKPHK